MRKVLEIDYDSPISERQETIAFRKENETGGLLNRIFTVWSVHSLTLFWENERSRPTGPPTQSAGLPRVNGHGGNNEEYGDGKTRRIVSVIEKVKDAREGEVVPPIDRERSVTRSAVRGIVSA